MRDSSSGFSRRALFKGAGVAAVGAILESSIAQAAPQIGPSAIASFVEHDAMQCGFCTPGMVMSCAALVRDNVKCTLDDVKRATSGHLCRRGTYPNVFKATLAAAGKPQKKVAGA